MFKPQFRYWDLVIFPVIHKGWKICVSQSAAQMWQSLAFAFSCLFSTRVSRPSQVTRECCLKLSIKSPLGLHRHPPIP